MMDQVMEKNKGKKFEGEVKRILVQSLNSLSRQVIKDGTSPYYSIQYHMVDLEQDKLYYKHLPSLFSVVAPSSMVVLGHTVYTFGMMNPSIVKSDAFKQLQSQPLLTKQNYLLDSCCLDLNSDTQVWSPASLPVKALPNFYCISLLGKIYAFSCRHLEIEVFDPEDGHWIPLSVPPELIDSYVSYYALPDPSNNRIIMRLCGGQLPSPSVYAFTPAANATSSTASAGTWKCLASDFHHWSPVAVVIDNLLFLHTYEYVGLLRAFDLATATWLEVTWAQGFDDNVDMNTTRLSCDALFPLDDNILCLASWRPLGRDRSQSLSEAKTYFRNFRVMRHGPTINLIPISAYSYLLPATCSVFEFVPV